MRPIIDYPIAYFITTVTKDRRRLFCDVRLAHRIATMIRMACRTKGYFLLGFCILPDHVHLLVMRQGILVTAFGGIPPSFEMNICGGKRTPWVRGREATDLSSPYTEGTLSRVPASVGDLMRSMKGTFSRTIQQGKIWQRRYHLRHVMNSEDLLNVVNYIQYNYQKDDLPESYEREPYMWLNKSILGAF
ncbi:MAG: transposase [Candidatus Kerfeldbacteria bacterium]|nr:transposase [Candidatus Kerfeldbacteria bacterium]